MIAVSKVFSGVLNGTVMQEWPVDGQRMMQQLLGASSRTTDRRKLPRSRYHLQTDLLITGNIEKTLTIYTRDINAWNVSFICSKQLLPGTKAVVQLMATDGRRTSIGCRTRRCQQFDAGWYDAFAEFCLPQYPFDNL